MLRYKLKERIADLEFRERRRVTLQEIADATALNRMTLSKMANHHGANIQTDALDRLCSYFGCRIEELVEHVEQDTDAISPR
ncbi:MAG TPA: helix-turn-helix transcriptional regulator [Aquimonas sp.]|jgi:DNA-binding Xre family transcriptional regulator|nr:helix-turn-helix transcriptional regulator [Aquimonas sp.]HRD73030.1 helix-turn-helix transcriptional regulator [Aquimonas sp.]HRF55386.1 helix-turn-helix transcriptional regulator [Aquimonas sp.]